MAGDVSIAELRSANRGHWFDLPTMRAWHSIVYEGARLSADGSIVFFVSSERDDLGAWAGKRRYTVRRMAWRDSAACPTCGQPTGHRRGDVLTDVSGFGEYRTLAQARAALDRFAECGL